jgi:hypothetical protein
VSNCEHHLVGISTTQAAAAKADGKAPGLIVKRQPVSGRPSSMASASYDEREEHLRALRVDGILRGKLLLHSSFFHGRSVDEIR